MRGYSQRKLVLGFGRPWTTVEEGAGAVERPVLAKDFAGVTGECFEGQRRARAEAQAYDEEARQRLRQMSERWVGL
jgi:hypothetical protein